ncbi:MAG: CarD family transcriptional regulator [Muricoprocola sp.]
MKFEIGDFVSKPVTGVCKVEDILYLKMSGVQNNKLYYLLIPIDHSQEKIYVPVSTSETNLRLCLTEEEAWNLIERIPDIQAVWVDNEKMREQKYKEIIKSNDPEALVSVIKMIYQRKKTRSAQGKKSTSSDDKYFQMAENLLYMELGTALGKPKQEICQLIIEHVDKK